MKHLYPIRMKFVFVLSFLLMSLIPSAFVKADDTFTATTEEGVEMTFMVLSEAEKTCQVGTEIINEPAIAEFTSGQVTIPAIANGYQVINIGKMAFSGCMELNSVIIPDGVVSIASQAFYFCKELTNVTIPNSVTTIGNGAFRDCEKLTSITIPNSVTSIGEMAFSGSGLTTITIPHSVTKIERYTFQACHNLAEVTIPSSITEMEGNVFHLCDGLTSIDVEEGNTNFTSQDGVLFTKDMTTLVRYPAGKTDSSYEIPHSVNSIGESAFTYCLNMTSVTIPDGVTSIGWSAFTGCRGLTSVSFPNSLNMIGMYAFAGCSSLISLTFPNNLTYIGDQAFEGCTQLKDVIFNTCIQYPSEVIFGDCSSLENVIIYDRNPTAIAERTFWLDWDGPMTTAALYVPAGTKALYEATEGWNKFQNIVEMEAGPNSVPYAIWCKGNSTLYFLCSNTELMQGGTYDGQTITNVWSGETLTNSPENEGVFSFRPMVWSGTTRTCTRIVFDQSFKDVRVKSTSAWIGSNVESIEGIEYLNTSEVTSMSYMFVGCQKLKTIDLSHFDTHNVKYMHSMFERCSSLTELDLSSFDTRNVETMSFMFYECTALTNLDLSSFVTSNVTDMQKMFAVIDGESNLQSIDMSHFDTGNLMNMYAMFYGCSCLETLDLSSFNTSRVTNMQMMFSQCSSLKTIYAGSGWSTVNVTDGSWMFGNCTSLVGGRGTVYDENNPHYTYAHIDGGTSNPGYLTDLSDAIFSDLCPDDHHPHMIDLGLPSGIRWACCNVGSDKPGSYGDYFAWGETETKGSYSQDTYSFDFSGTDIAGTEYDVAHVKWGDLWTMPNLDHMNELLTNCTYESASYDGVQGYKFTSKINGNSIFLPASGCCVGTEYVDIDQVGYYWTSNYSEISSNCASILSFHDNQAYSSSRVTREAGRSVRPIVGEAGQRIFLHSKEVEGVTFALYRQAVNRFDIRKNYDGWEMYRTKVTLDITENGVTDTYLIDDALYEDVNSDGQIPCMLFDLENRMMYAFCLSKGEDVYYGMEGYVYSSPMDIVNFQKEQIFTYANWGWWASFAGMGNALPQLSHFSFAGYYGMASERNEDGSWTTDYIESIQPDDYKAYWLTQDLMLVLGQPVDIEPLENGDVIDFSDFVDESGVEVLPNLDGNIVGNLFFNILNDNGGYDSDDGCIVITESTPDESLAQIADKDFFDKELHETFTGIIFKVPAGTGNIKVTAQTTGNVLLKVKIGDAEPSEFELGVKKKVKIPYNVTEETLVYIYAGGDVNVKGVQSATSSSGALKIYSIESESIPTGITIISDSSNAVIYNLGGQRLTKPQKGINIVGGKKVVVK